MELTELKKVYSEIEKKHKLPSFEKLNEDFEIDKIERNSDQIIKYFRKAMMEKIVNSLGFLEMLLNSANSPRMYIPYLRTMTPEERKKIEDIYFSLGQLSIDALELEINSSEKAEAEIIKKIYKTWYDQKPKFSQILFNIKKPNNTVSSKKEKTYFG